MPTPILNYTDLLVTTSDKNTTINTIFSEIELSLQENLTVNLASDVTLTTTQYTRNNFFDCTPVTGARLLTVPATIRIFYVKNSGTGTVTVRNPTGATVLLTAGSAGLLYNDGANITSILLNNVNTFPELADTPANYTGGANRILRVNSGATAVEFGIRNNMTATTNPAVTDDSSANYSVGSMWFNTNTNTAWMCVSATVGAAVWEEYLPRRVMHCGYGTTGNADTALLNGPLASPLPNILYLYPFRFYGGTTIIRLFNRTAVAGSADANCKFAMWANNYTTGRPFGTPVASNNTPISLTVAGIKTATVSASPEPGIYWLGTVVEGTTIPGLLSINSAHFEYSQIAGASWTAAEVFKTTANIGIAGISTPLTFATNISTFNLTGATFTNETTAVVPRVGVGW